MTAYKSVKLILWIILFANFLVCAVKIGVGMTLGSQSAIADGIHSFSDGASNIVGLIGIWLASKPTDKKHPYGHSKFEIIASLFIGVMLAFMSVQIMSRAVSAFQNPVNMDINLVEGALMVLTIVVNIVVAVTEYRFGKKLKSTILVTDSLHTRGDILISAVVFLGLIAIKLGVPSWVDTVMSLGVALFVMFSAWEIIKGCVDVLVDSAAVSSDEIKDVVLTVPGVYNVHHIRSRGGVSQVFIDLHVIVDPKDDIVMGHNLSHKLEAVLKEHFGANTEVYIHVEPDDGLHGNKLTS